ncbi:hypothetical protein GGR04_002110 [Aureimonas pseudogalii]|uniref:Uncharacterized protein n=2 Tax=Aureimonas pseudogalii TaxID=1744844 RepID=A0A7W6EBG6_9HYPH|nr:hypothetical protein [Aureimonas pseudogalii]
MIHLHRSEGEVAFTQGIPRSRNPHAVETPEWNEWMDGFDAAASQAENPHGVSPPGDHVRVL